MSTVSDPGAPRESPDGRDPFGLLGQVLDGQFRIDAVVGEGGFSVVYRGEHVGLGEPIAIKCLKLQPQLGSALVESFIRRFRDEGRILYRLSQGHLHIVRSIASGTTIAPATSSIVPYTVLEWLDGNSLAFDYEDRRARGLGGRSLAELTKLIDSAVDAVAYAHAQGVVHRDLNPGNLFLAKTREGPRAKVLDFGVAKVVSDHAMELGPRAATFGSIRIFSPAYAAPEQFDDSLGKIAPWTDVYALALLLLEGMLGDPPVTGDTLGELINRTLDPNARPTPRAFGLDVSPEVEAVFARALTIDPTARFHDAGEFWGALKNAMQQGARAPAVAPVATSTRVTPPPSPVASAPSSDVGRTLKLGGDDSKLMEVRAAAALAQITPVAAPPPPADPSEGGRPSEINKTLPLTADPRFMAARAAAVEQAQAMVASSSVAHAPSGSHPVASVSGAFTPPPPPAAPRQTLPPEPPSSRGRLAAILVGAAAALFLLGAAVVAFVVWSKRAATVGEEGPIEIPSAESPPSAAASTPPPLPEATTSPPETPDEPPVVASASPSAPVSAPDEPSAPVAPTATATVLAATSTPASSSSATNKTPPAPSDAPQVDPNAFSPTVARAKLGVLDGILASCKRSDPKVGDGVAKVTFANDGTVSNIDIIGPIAGAPEANCVASRYRSAKVPPFEGPPGAVEHPFKLPKP